MLLYYSRKTVVGSQEKLYR